MRRQSAEVTGVPRPETRRHTSHCCPHFWGQALTPNLDWEDAFYWLPEPRDIAAFRSNAVLARELLLGNKY